MLQVGLGVPKTKRTRFLFTGIVQGVGFRPFIYRLAHRYNLSGFVQNRSDGVAVEVEGEPWDIDGFLEHVKKELPPVASISGITSEEIETTGGNEFSIITSEKTEGMHVHISPDIATCDMCLKELFDTGDRRFRYPFINCTNCGPRLTIIKDIPYDRENTSMACFPMCKSCKKEYNDPLDRRFHAEPDACPECGPRLWLLDSSGRRVDTPDPLKKAIELISAGHILAIKGLGGFHLGVDAGNDDAVKRLRERKFREEKPFAIMVKDIAHARLIAEVGREEEAVLKSPERPIVLLKKKDGILSGHVAPGMYTYGIMLPYTPLHHLLLEDRFNALVMTSANLKDEPICTGNREALARLNGIAEFFLVHNRDIVVRCDDSIVFVPSTGMSVVRRSRGFSPRPVRISEPLPGVLALGAHMKTTVCLLKHDMAFISPHVGDLETPLARDFLCESISLMERITKTRPDFVASDIHPDYYSTRLAQRLGRKQVIQVQHHHAHIVSCMAENMVSGKVIGLAMDGTGYGTDGAVWGGEFLLCDEAAFLRAGHIGYFVLPGGEKAVKEPWRVGVSLVKEAFGGSWREIASGLSLVDDVTLLPVLDGMIEKGLNSPLTSSLGRFFDGIAAILGVRKRVNFEGQAAMELEAIAAGSEGMVFDHRIVEHNGSMILDLLPAVRALVEGIEENRPREFLARSFHETLISAFTDVALTLSRSSGLRRVVLSGGCFQNRILVEGLADRLTKKGMDVFFHHLIPTNDGGISLGQAVCAGYRIKSNI